MNEVIRTVGLARSAAFAHASTRYWLSVFPAVGHELRRRRALALRVPDPALRRLALQALDRKRCNLEGAAAFELLARGESSPSLIRTLTACQAMCDYLDLLAEQPTPDPVLNGACLHQALTVALTPAEAHRDYYAHHAYHDDGGYLKTLVEDVRAGIVELPAFACVQASLVRCAERIAAYQSFNHGDVHGSYALFERWASAQRSQDSGLLWWEVGGGAGSTLTVFALIACAVDEHLDESAAQAVERAYFPWIGALHSLLDSLVDHPEDLLTGERGLIGCYCSPEVAGERLCAIAREALERAGRLPNGNRHRLLVTAMTGFYLCEARQLQSAHARAAAPELLSAVGRLGGVAMRMMSARHAMRRPRRVGCRARPVMHTLPTRLSGPALIQPFVYGDERGFFAETYRHEWHAQAGIAQDLEFVQDNHSRSARGVVRGLHFHTGVGAAKLVRCARGKIFDVVVDLRCGSPTFGEWEGFELDDVRLRVLFVPIGFAHGFCVLSEEADVVYKQSNYHLPDIEASIAWNDPDIAIEWPLDGVRPTISERDASAPRLRELDEGQLFAYEGQS